MKKITYYCDRCKQEMPEPTSRRELCFSEWAITIEVATTDGTEAHLCKYCIAMLVTDKLDDRPRPSY